MPKRLREIAKRGTMRIRVEDLQRDCVDAGVGRNRATHFGVILLADNEDVVGYDLRFRSSDDGNVDQPYLDVIDMQPTKTVYFLKDHLGSIRATVDDIGQVVGYDDYDPWGFILAGRSMATGASTVQGAAKNKFTGKEWDDEFGLNVYHFGPRPYDGEIGRFLGIDPLADAYPAWTPYHYALNNPVVYFDLDGRSTVTDSAGNVIHVNTEDNDLSVYQATTEQGGTNEFGIAGGPMSVKKKVGETEYLDEFLAHDNETGETLDEIQPGARILFSESWNEIIDALNKVANEMGLARTALNSRAGKTFDIKVQSKYAPYGPGTGKLLNGKYATARSAGNYLAGLSGATGTFLGKQISLETFMRLAGFVHAGVNRQGPPYYGEIPYAGRRIVSGFQKGLTLRKK